MNTPNNNNTTGKSSKLGQAMTMVGAAGLLAAMPALAHADDPYSMAPPVQGVDSQVVSNAPGDVSATSVFNWQEVPQNQEVPIHRAVFDQGGYQLYDTSGETIVVPFVNQNLYVMKFAVSTNDTMYFVNDAGSAPVLYVPENGYLENATVPGARWFPFNEKFHPETPVFVGIAPSWDAYCNMGWYPRMVCYGGYWCGTSIGIFTPTLGLFFNIGGHPYYGWGGYEGYYNRYPAPYRISYNNINIYHYAGHQYWGGRSWGGYTRPYYANRPSGSGYGYRTFSGTGHPITVSTGSAGNRSGFGYPNGHGTSSPSTYNSAHAVYGGSDRAFSNEYGYGSPNASGAVSNSGHVFRGVPSSSGSHSYAGYTGTGHSGTAGGGYPQASGRSYSSGSHVFQGASSGSHSYSGPTGGGYPQASGRSYSSGGHTFQGASSSGHSYSGSAGYGHASSYGGAHGGAPASSGSGGYHGSAPQSSGGSHNSTPPSSGSGHPSYSGHS